MRNSNNGLRSGAMAVRRKEFALAAFRCLTIAVVVSISHAIPARCSAQTLNLNLTPDSSYAIYENGDGSQVSLFESAISGSVGILDGVDPSVFKTTVNNGSIITSINPTQATLPTAGFNYNGNLNVQNTGTTLGMMSFNGSSAVNVFNINGDFNASNSILNLVASAANETFIFNVSGDAGGTDALNFNGVTMNLSGGLVASNVIFDVLNGQNANISSGSIKSGTITTTIDSTTFGTFYTDTGNISVNDSSQVTGALVAGGGGTIDVANSTVTAEPFVAPDSPVAAAPEMPTIMTAGLAAVVLVVSSYFNRLRRQRLSSARALAA
jgi:hypothetical protein